MASGTSSTTARDLFLIGAMLWAADQRYHGPFSSYLLCETWTLHVAGCTLYAGSDSLKLALLFGLAPPNLSHRPVHLPDSNYPAVLYHARWLPQGTGTSIFHSSPVLRKSTWSIGMGMSVVTLLMNMYIQQTLRIGPKKDRLSMRHARHTIASLHSTSERRRALSSCSMTSSSSPIFPALRVLTISTALPVQPLDAADSDVGDWNCDRARWDTGVSSAGPKDTAFAFGGRGI